MSWSTTFYYGQELRSVYMNNMINGLIKPGIYNADGTIFTVPNDVVGEDPGVYLRLKSGTTLVFSNGYDEVGGKQQRNIDKVGTYVVKCVLDGDESFLLASPGKTGSDFLTRGYADAPVKFVYAYFHYDPTGVGDTSPRFQLAAPSQNSTNFESYTLPNEGKSGSAVNLYNSYLLVGVLIDNKQTAPTGNSYATEVGGWGIDAEQTWIRNHIFTARGLPDYRCGMFKTTETAVPSVLFHQTYKHMYLTPGQFFFGSGIHKLPGLDWKKMYGQDQTPTSTTSDPPTTTSGYTIDTILQSASATTYTADTFSLTGKGGKLVLDFLFLSIDTEYTSITYTAAGTPAPIDLSDLLTAGKYDLKKKLLPIKVVSSYNGDVNWDSTSRGAAYGKPTNKVVPLDIGKSNQQEIRKLLHNKNIVLPVIDMIRQQADNSTPYLDPKVGTSLVPIFVAVRQINTGATNYTDPASSTTVGGVNPANIISFLELQASTFAITGASLLAEEVFPTIPLLD